VYGGPARPGQHSIISLLPTEKAPPARAPREVQIVHRNTQSQTTVAVGSEAQSSCADSSLRSKRLLAGSVRNGTHASRTGGCGNCPTFAFTKRVASIDNKPRTSGAFNSTVDDVVNQLLGGRQHS
jgi:hypothetical protein